MPTSSVVQNNQAIGFRETGWKPAEKRKTPTKLGCIHHQYLTTHETSWKVVDFTMYMKEQDVSMITAIRESFLFKMILDDKNPTKELNPRTKTPWIEVQSEVFEKGVLQKIADLRLKYMSVQTGELDLEELYCDFIFLQNIICMKIEYQEAQFAELHKIYWEKFFPRVQKKGSLYKFSSHSHFLIQKILHDKEKHREDKFILA
jgi:hypothetical protein